jgi:hypothetical protein
LETKLNFLTENYLLRPVEPEEATQERRRRKSQTAISQWTSEQNFCAFLLRLSSLNNDAAAQERAAQSSRGFPLAGAASLSAHRKVFLVRLCAAAVMTAHSSFIFARQRRMLRDKATANGREFSKCGKGNVRLSSAGSAAAFPRFCGVVRFELGICWGLRKRELK